MITQIDNYKNINKEDFLRGFTKQNYRDLINKEGLIKAKRWLTFSRKFDFPFELINGTIDYFRWNKSKNPNLEKNFWKKFKITTKINKAPQKRIFQQKTQFSIDYKYIKLNKGISDLLFKETIKILDIKKFLEKFKLSKINFNNYFYCDYFIPFKLVKEVSSFLKKDFRQYIIAAKNYKRDTVKNPKFDINFTSPEGTRIRAHIRGDGGIDVNGRVLYYNDNRILLNEFEKDIISLFGNCVITKVKTENKIYVSKTISKFIINALHYPLGEEIKHDIGIDRDILNGPKEIKQNFIRVYYDDEGRYHSNSLEIVKVKDFSYLDSKTIRKVLSNSKQNQRYAPQLLLDIKRILDKSEIISTLTTNKGNYYLRIDNGGKLRFSVNWILRITGENNIRKFYNLFTPKITKKRQDIKNYLDNIKVSKPPRNKAWLIALQGCWSVVKEGRSLTINSLSENTNKSWRTSYRLIKSLEGNNLIKKFKNKSIIRDKLGKIIKTNSTEYILTEKGHQFLQNPEKANIDWSISLKH